MMPDDSLYCVGAICAGESGWVFSGGIIIVILVAFVATVFAAYGDKKYDTR